MKKKLLSIVSVVLAMSMTTSAFAATARGTGDVDGDGQITANDVFKIMQGLAAEDAEANVDGRTGIDGLDARVLYNTILQPKTVSEDLTLKAYSEGMANDVEFGAFNAADLGSTTGHEAPNGLKEVATNVDTSTTTTIKDAIDQLVDLAANQRAEGITNQLNKIYFVSAVKGDVYLRSENGWAMFCNALRYIVPMDEETAVLCNRVENGTSIAEIEANAELKARYDALNEVKAIIVGEQEDPAAVNESALSASDIIAAKDALYRAIPSGLTDDEITATAKEVLKITDTKYVFSIDSEVTGQEDLSEAGVDTSAFIKGLLDLKNYDTATMADYRNTFGDKLTVGTPNVKVTFEVAVVAGVDEDSSEATTNTPSEPTTEAPTETSSEAPAETSSEAPTETSSEAPTETSSEVPTETTTDAPVEVGITGSGSIKSPDVNTALNGAALADGAVLADGVSIINGGGAFSWSEKTLNFNDGAVSLGKLMTFQIGKGNKTIATTHSVGDVLSDTEVIEKAIKFTTGGAGTITVYAGLGSSGIEDAPVYLIDLNTKTVVAVANINRPGGSGNNYVVEAVNVPAAGEYAFLQPGNLSSLNVGQIDYSIN